MKRRDFMSWPDLQYNGHFENDRMISEEMENRSIYKHIPLAALFATLGVIFPVFFHITGLGSAFMPMFIPIIMGSMLLPPSLAVTIAFITPVVSFLLTGMPPVYPPILILVIAELLTVSLLSSYLYFMKNWSVWITLVIAMGADRLVLFAFVFFLAKKLGFPGRFFSAGAVIYSIPGVVLIFLIIPLTLKFLQRKYPQILQSQQ